MVKPKMRVFQSQLVGFRNRQHLQDEIFTFSSSSQSRTYLCSWGVGGWNWHLRVKLLERRSALPLCSKYLTPLRFGSVRKMGGGANILGNLGFKTWSLDNISFHDRDDVDDDAAHCPWPTHPFQARGCSLLTHFSCQAPSTVFCPTQCCPPVLPTVLHSVAHLNQSIIRKLFSKSITGNVSKSQYWFQSCHFEIASQPSQAVTISFRSIRFQDNRIIRQEPVWLSKTSVSFLNKSFLYTFNTSIDMTTINWWGAIIIFVTRRSRKWLTVCLPYPVSPTFFLPC